MKSFKRFLFEAETRVGSTIFKLSKAEMKELRRIVKKSGSKVMSVSSLAARPKVARDMIRKHGDASVIDEARKRKIELRFEYVLQGAKKNGKRGATRGGSVFSETTADARKQVEALLRKGESIFSLRIKP